jgi:hypothetical protein
MPTYYLNGPAGLPTPTVKLLSATDPTTTIATITPTESPAGVYSFTTSETGLLLVQVLSGSTPVGSGLETLGVVDKWVWEAVRLDASQPDYAPAKAGNAMSLLAATRDAVAAATAEATGQEPIFEGTLTAVVNGTNAEFGGTLSDEGRATVDAYRLAVLRVFSGSHPPIEYQIQSYVPSTGVFRVSRAWLVAPSVGDVVQVFARLTPAINSAGEVTQNQSQSDVWFRTFITARSGNTITLQSGPAANTSIVGQLIRVHSGPVQNRGFTTSVTDYDVPTRVATLSDPLPANPLGNFQDSIAIAFAKVLGAPTTAQNAEAVRASLERSDGPLLAIKSQTDSMPTTSQIATAVATALAGQAITITFPQQVGANIAIVQSTDSYEIAVTNPGSGAWPSDVASRQIWFYAQSKTDITQRIATQGSYSSSAARVTVSRTASNVTPGVYEWRLEAVAGDGTRSPLLTKPGELRIYDDLRG